MLGVQVVILEFTSPEELDITDANVSLNNRKN